MASPQAERVFTELWTKTNHEIEQNHKDYWPRIKGFLSNAIGQQHSKATTGASVAGTVASYFLKQIPVIGSALAAAGQQAVNSARNYWNEKNIKDPSVSDRDYAQANNDWWVQKGLQAYIDAVRKYDDAVKEYKTADPETNCTAYKRKLGQQLYARYRLRRLESYYHMMASFQLRVKAKLDEANGLMKREIEHTQKEGAKFFEKDREGMHLANCRDGCMYPWPGGISRPFNVQGHSSGRRI